MISPIESNGMIARTQDYSSFRLQEDNKANVAHVSIQERIDEKGQSNVRSVHNADNSDRPGTEHDAREEGRNKYFNMRKEKKSEKKENDGKVTVKKSFGFDLKI